MASPMRHFTRCMIAGIVALLPLGGAAFMVLWLENMLSSGWLRDRAFYFPGLGLLLALAAIYLAGMFVTTFVGRWLWRRVDRAIEAMPLLGAFYQSLKEVLGYDSTRERFFHGVVLVDTGCGDELGLVTGTAAIDGGERTMVFVPGSPNPANGRLLLVPSDRVRKVDVRSAAALRTLVAMGKTPLRPPAE